MSAGVGGATGFAVRVAVGPTDDEDPCAGGCEVSTGTLLRSLVLLVALATSPRVLDDWN